MPCGQVVIRNCQASSWLELHSLGRYPGGGNGYSLQCSCLGNPKDRGAWQATVHGLAKSQTRLSTYTHTHTQRNHNIKSWQKQLSNPNGDDHKTSPILNYFLKFLIISYVFLLKNYTLKIKRHQCLHSPQFWTWFCPLHREELLHPTCVCRERSWWRLCDWHLSDIYKGRHRERECINTGFLYARIGFVQVRTQVIKDHSGCLPEDLS